MHKSLPYALLSLISYFKKLPGVGNRSATRYAFQMLKWPEKELKEFGIHLMQLSEKIVSCKICGCLKENEKTCFFCDPVKRNPETICIVSSPKDVYAIEETCTYSGFYHVIDHLLSPIEQKNEELLYLNRLQKTIHQSNTKEIIIALDSTVEGDATALFFKDVILQWKPEIKISRLAFGMPLNSSLEYVDENTLGQSFIGRMNF